MLSDELIAKIGADLDVLPLQPTSRRELELLVVAYLWEHPCRSRTRRDLYGDCQTNQRQRLSDQAQHPVRCVDATPQECCGGEAAGPAQRNYIIVGATSECCDRCSTAKRRTILSGAVE